MAVYVWVAAGFVRGGGSVAAAVARPELRMGRSTEGGEPPADQAQAGPRVLPPRPVRRVWCWVAVVAVVVTRPRCAGDGRGPPSRLLIRSSGHRMDNVLVALSSLAELELLVTPYR